MVYFKIPNIPHNLTNYTWDRAPQKHRVFRIEHHQSKER